MYFSPSFDAINYLNFHRHIFFLKKHDLWDPWKTEWGVEVNNVTEVPKVVDHRLVFKIKQVS